MMIATPDSLKKSRQALIILARGVAKASLWCQAKPEQCEKLQRNVSKEEWATPKVAKPLLVRAMTQMTKLQEGRRIGEPVRANLENYLKFLKSSNPKFQAPKADEFLKAHSLGVFAMHRETQADISTVVMAGDASGYAARVSKDAGDIDGEDVAREAVDRTTRVVNPRTVGPGDYEVILEPYAVVDMLDFFSYLSFGALPYLEKRSFMSGRLGERVMDEKVTIWDDGLSPSGIPMPFDYEGVPKRRVTFIERGVAREVAWDSYYAGKAGGGQLSTGHALLAGNTIGPMPMHLFMSPGDATLDDMVRGTKRGLLVTRFWYTRTVHPLNVVTTGMTRDGTFLVEDGRIVGPVANVRFTQDYVDALNHVELVGREPMLVLGDIGGGVRSVPALKLAKWHVTGISET